MSYNPPDAWKGTDPIERAAHLYQCFEVWRATQICEEEGISRDDMLSGSERAERDRQKRAAMRRVYGDPAYGAWPAGAWEKWPERV